MSNFVAILTAVVAIAEVIIQATAEKASKKISKAVYSSIVLFIVSIFGVAFDIIFNTPVVNAVYVFEAIGLVVMASIVPQVSYDKVKEILDIVKKLMK